MDSLERYLPKWPETSLQMGLTAAGAAIVSFLLLRGLFKQRKQLKGKVVVITGASSGIGEALATEFVQKGCKVILAARSIEKLKQLKEKLVSSYKIAEDSIACFFLDLEDHDAIEEACSSLLALYGKVDILVNNAGISGGDRVEKCHLQTYKKIMDINYFGQVALTKGLLPHMIQQKGGTIVAISSLQGKFAIPKRSAYGASKHALQAFFDSLRHENVKNGIDVLVVSPGYVKTNLAQSSLTGTGERSGAQTKEIDNGMSPETCAKAVLKAIINYDTDLLIGRFHHKLVVYIRTLCPSLYNYIMSRL